MKKKVCTCYDIREGDALMLCNKCNGVRKAGDFPTIQYLAKKAFDWLSDNHDWALYNLSIELVMVNPRTKEIDDNEYANTELAFWLETGEFEDDMKTHNLRYDCGAPTMEEAIIKLAGKISNEYKQNDKVLQNP